jgi:cobalt/nickel transport protein
MEKFRKKLFIGLLMLALISPVGLLLPKWFKAGDAWGEWPTDTIEKKLGYVPEGMHKDADTWKAPMPDYSLGSENSPPGEQSLKYILSALVGLAIISFLSFGVVKMMRKE